MSKEKSIKVILICMMGIFLLSVICIQIVQVNSKVSIPKVEEYKIGENVELEKNYFYSEIESCDGYSIRVNNVELLTYTDFLKKYNSEEQEKSLISREDPLFPDMVYDVEITISNTNTDDKEYGIDVGMYGIYAADFDLQFENTLYDIANPEVGDGIYAFKLQPQTEMEFHLPFGVPLTSKYAYLNKKVVEESKLSMVLSLYPVQKQIVIQEGSR